MNRIKRSEKKPDPHLKTYLSSLLATRLAALSRLAGNSIDINYLCSILIRESTAIILPALPSNGLISISIISGAV